MKYFVKSFERELDKTALEFNSKAEAIKAAFKLMREHALEEIELGDHEYTKGRGWDYTEDGILSRLSAALEHEQPNDGRGYKVYSEQEFNELFND